MSGNCGEEAVSMRRVRPVFTSILAVLVCAAIIAFGAPGPVMAEGEKDAATEAQPAVAQPEVAQSEVAKTS